MKPFAKICYKCLKKKPSQDGPCPYCGYDNDKYAPREYFLPPFFLLKNNYLLGKALGTGGFGITYVALDIKLQRLVAVKELYIRSICKRDKEEALVRVEPGREDSFGHVRSRFLDEARMIAMLNARNPDAAIVKVFDYFTENSTAYMVMEYLSGENLRTRVRHQGPIPYRKLIPLLRPAAMAVSCIHACHVVHKDISPDNIMVLPDGTVRLLDFGAAQSLDGSFRPPVATYKKGYAPPEQYPGEGNEHIGTWSDVYAFCATICFCLTGEKPPESVARQEKDTLKIPMKAFGPMGKRAKEALLQGLKLDYRKRTPSIKAFWKEFERGRRMLPFFAPFGGVAVLAAASMLYLSPLRPLPGIPDIAPARTDSLRAGYGHSGELSAGDSYGGKDKAAGDRIIVSGGLSRVSTPSPSPEAPIEDPEAQAPTEQSKAQPLTKEPEGQSLTEEPEAQPLTKEPETQPLTEEPEAPAVTEESPPPPASPTPVPPEKQTGRIPVTAGSLPYALNTEIPVTAGTYIFENAAERSLILGVNGGFPDNGTSLMLRSYKYENSNRFFVIPTDDGGTVFNIRAAHTNSPVVVKDNGGIGSLVVQDNVLSAGTSADWSFIYCGEDKDRPGQSVVIIKNKNGYVLAPEGGKVAAGSRMVLTLLNLGDSAQKWSLRWNERDESQKTMVVFGEGQEVTNLSGSFKIISGRDAHMAMAASSDPNAAEQQLITWEAVTDISQIFIFEPASLEGDGNYYYKIRPARDETAKKEYLEYDPGSQRVFLRPENSSPNQLFRVIYDRFNRFIIRSYDGTSLGLDAREDGTSEGVAIKSRYMDAYEDKDVVLWYLREAG